MKYKVPLWAVLVLVLVIVLSGVFGGNYFYKDYKEQLQREQQKIDSLYNVSKKREDSLMRITQEQKEFADGLRRRNNELRYANNNLYNELKKRNRQIFVIDTAFMSNARRISKSTDRFYKANDTIR